MQNIQIFTSLSKEISTLTSTFTTEVMQNIATNITPIVIAGLVLYFTIYGFLVFNQTIQQPLNSFLMELFKISIITGIALTGGIYQEKIADIIISVPEDFAKLAFNGADDTFSIADQLITTGLNKANELYKSVSILKLADGIAKSWIALVIASSTITLGSIGGFLLLMVKINCTVLAAIGPLFIVALLFKQTRQLFSNWLGEIVGYGIFSLILTVVFVFILKIAEKYLSAIQDNDNKLIATFVFVILVIVGVLLLFQAKKMAERLAGVFNMGLAGMSSDFMSNSIRAATNKSINAVSRANNSGGGRNNSDSQNKMNKSTGWRKKR